MIPRPIWTSNNDQRPMKMTNNYAEVKGFADVGRQDYEEDNYFKD